VLVSRAATVQIANHRVKQAEGDRCLWRDPIMTPMGLSGELMDAPAPPLMVIGFMNLDRVCREGSANRQG